jgi:hypothetical protein
MSLCKLGTDVCNFRHSIFTATSSNPLPEPFRTNCVLPDKSLSDIFGKSKLPFNFNIRPAGGIGFGILSDADMLWRSDCIDDTHVTRAKAFLTQVFENVPPRNGENGGIIGVITHGEMVDAIYKAAGIGNGYSPFNTEVVPLLVEMK